jgi:hypothetical protein
MLQACLSRCCICFTYILQVFYLDVTYVCNDFQLFLQVFLLMQKWIYKHKGLIPEIDIQSVPVDLTC